MTVAQFFDRAIAWERAAEAFYSGLAEMFCGAQGGLPLLSRGPRHSRRAA